jgi:predicted AlkP superfamily pyrophosphatase or phosphodiesterase
MQSDYSLTSIAPTISQVMGLRPPRQAESPPIAEAAAGLEGAGRLALIILDAFGLATWQAHREAAPAFAALANEALLTLRSVLPCKTPVCFATIATGAEPEVHSVRKRQDEMKAETVFHVLREQKRTSAVAGRDASSARIVLSRFADFARVAASNTDAEVLDLALDVVATKTPDFLLVQFLDIDNAGHRAGPGSPESRQAVADTDRRLASLLDALTHHGYALLVTADHGQHDRRQEDGTVGGEHDASVPADLRVPLTWRGAEEE